MEIQKYFEINNNNDENTIYQLLCDASKSLVKEKCLVLSYSKGEISEILEREKGRN